MVAWIQGSRKREEELESKKNFTGGDVHYLDCVDSLWICTYVKIDQVVHF